MRGHKLALNLATFNREGTLVATASWDRTAMLWDTKNGNLLGTLSGHYERVWSAAFSADGSRLLTASGDQTARIWDIHLESRTAGEMAALVRCGVPFELQQGRLLPKPVPDGCQPPSAAEHWH